MANGPQFPIIRYTNFDASDASFHWAYGGGQTVYVDRTAFMNQGPGQAFQIQDVPAIRSAFGSLSSGQTIFNNTNSDNFETTHDFYWDGVTGIVSDEAFVFGRSSAVFKGSVTGVTNNIVLVDGELRPYDDQFDFNANTWNPFLETARGIGRLLEGPGTSFKIKFAGGDGRFVYGLLEKVVTYSGRGTPSVAYKFTPLPEPDARCFPANTPIQTSLTTTTQISDLRVGDVVLAFDPHAELGRGALVPRRVTRLFHNTTTEWIKLTWLDPVTGEARELVATPGHHMLDKFGRFARLDALVQGNTCEIILSSGDCIMAQAERLVYSAATADMFERGTVMAATSGALAMAPQSLDAWATYNFEVEDLHTYVAGGVRVHNISLFTPDPGSWGSLADTVSGQISNHVFGNDTLQSAFASANDNVSTRRIAA
jgi:hypothetical protein